MSKSQCPHCGKKLGQYYYADACPHCRHELEHNTRLLVSVPTKDPNRERIWLVRMLLGVVRFVES
jgi:predicted amidophosphoribosyltransferase